MQSTDDGQPKTRRRLSDSRIAELLGVATTVFLEKGFTAASTAEIAERANASKTTFYKRFPNKELLFIAVIERYTEDVFRKLGEIPKDAPLAASLRLFARRFLRILLSQEHTALVQLICSEVRRQPHLVTHFHLRGAKRAEDLIKSYLEEQIKAGRVQGADARTMARHFMSLITGTPVRWIILGFEPSPLSRREIDAHLEASLNLFIRGYATGSSHSASS